MKIKKLKQFFLPNKLRERILKMGMESKDIDRMVRLVNRGIYYYGLCHSELSYRIKINKYSWEVNVFDKNTVEYEMIPFIKFMVKYSIKRNNDNVHGYVFDRLNETIEDFINTDRYRKFYKVRICDIKFYRQEYQDNKFGVGNILIEKGKGRIPYNFIKYNSKKNRTLKHLEYEWRKIRKENGEDINDFFEWK